MLFFRFEFVKIVTYFQRRVISEIKLMALYEPLLRNKYIIHLRVIVLFFSSSFNFFRFILLFLQNAFLRKFEMSLMEPLAIGLNDCPKGSVNFSKCGQPNILDDRCSYILFIVVRKSFGFCYYLLNIRKLVIPVKTFYIYYTAKNRQHFKA